MKPLMIRQNPPDIVCIGSALWDIIGRTPLVLQLGGDVPGRITRVPGGVALNIAVTLARLGLRPAILTAIGRDAEGEALLAACARLGVDARHAYRSDHLPTDVYMAVEAANGLIAAVADAHGLEAAGARILQALGDGTLGSQVVPWPGLIALDGNLTAALMAHIAGSALFARADLRLAPASPEKAGRLAPLIGLARATLYLNLEEARVLAESHVATAAAAAQALLAMGAHRVLVTDGGRACADGLAGAEILVAHPPQVRVARVTGAGDTFMAAHIVAERGGVARQAALAAALAAAAAYISQEVGG